LTRFPQFDTQGLWSEITVPEGEARAETEQEILEKAAEHAETVHKMKEIPEEVLAQVRGAIRDE
jgi:predicted small metal-binding protein